MTNKEQFADETYKIHVEGRHVDVTSPMKDYAVEKISKIERFTNQILDIVVTMDIQKLEHRVDIVVKVGHTRIKSHASTTDMYASIDMAVDKLKQQISRWKTKLRDHHARPLSVVDMNVNVFKRPEEANLEEINEEIEEANNRELLDEYRPQDVSEQKTIPLKNLTLDEAIMKMELSGDAFLLFRAEDEVEKPLKVIYRTKKGDYGVFKPE